MKTYNTIVVNAFGGPGAGKTTAAWHIAAELKKQGYCVEYVSEYAKELVWEEDYDLLDGSLEHQIIMFQEQKKRINRLIGKVDMVVTDSPLLLNIMYLNVADKDHEERVLAEYKKNHNFNFVVQRGRSFEQAGRIHDKEESIQKDKEIQEFLDKNNIYYGTYVHEKVDTLIRNIVDHYERIQQKTNIENTEVKGDNDMKLVISGKMAKVEFREVERGSSKHQVVNFTTFAYDGNAPLKEREDGSKYKAGIPLKCVAWDDRAEEIRQMLKDGKNTITAAVTMRYNEYESRNGYTVIEPQYVIRKIDHENDLHKQMSSLLSCYEEGKINQVFEKEIQPDFSEELDQEMDIPSVPLEKDNEREKE